ncbi:hypothetical protein B0T42_06085 [Rathayibacter sp. VKM Ac-2630]|nr:hypothetical protein B0T42_06085 [Rathayibacter sp. VKM Ac-2630]
MLVDSYARPWPAGVQILGAGIAAGAWALSSHTPPRPALIAALAGAGAWLASDSLLALGAAPLMASAAPALVIGLLGEALSDRMRIPAVVTTACGIVPLLPGLTLYRGVLDLTSGGDPTSGIELLLQAGMIAVGLAGGVTLGRIAYRRLRTPVVRAVAPVRARARRDRGMDAALAADVLYSEGEPSPTTAPLPVADPAAPASDPHEPLVRTGTLPIVSTIGAPEANGGSDPADPDRG